MEIKDFKFYNFENKNWTNSTQKEIIEKENLELPCVISFYGEKSYVKNCIFDKITVIKKCKEAEKVSCTTADKFIFWKGTSPIGFYATTETDDLKILEYLMTEYKKIN